jgi:RNA polymerase I specific transcription initiation factor RRN3
VAARRFVEIVKQLLPPPLAPHAAAPAAPPQNEAHLIGILECLAACAAALDASRHEALLRALYGLSLWHAPPAMSRAWLALLHHLTAARAAHVPAVVAHLVDAFAPPPPLALAMAGGPERAAEPLAAPYAPDARTAAVHDAALSALGALLAQRPLAAATVRDAVGGRMPHRLQPWTRLCPYIHATLLLAGALLHCKQFAWSRACLLPTGAHCPVNHPGF